MRGFIFGRQLAQNAVDLDHSARQTLGLIHTLKIKKLNFWSELPVQRGSFFNDMPLSLLLAFASAFPSVCHAWVRFMLLFISMRCGLFLLVVALCIMNQAFSTTLEGMQLIFFILSGVFRVAFCLDHCLL